MKKSKVIFLALFASAFGAMADSVSVQQAARAARAWAARGERMGSRIGRAVSSVVQYETTNGVPFFAVSMASGGTIFLSGDTASDPVVAFTPQSGVSPERGSPLWEMLNRDLSSRAASASGAAKWAKLLAAADAIAASDVTVAISSESALDDVRVSPMLKTKWAQDVAYTSKSIDAEINCFNYYTPSCVVERVEKDGSTVRRYESTVCGCVATAMAQVLKYWEHPAGELDSFKVTCNYPVSAYLEWNSKTGDYDPKKYESRSGVLTASAGAYDWANMPDEPLSLVSDGFSTRWSGEPVTEEQCRAIGKLTYDCGVAVGMNFNLSEFGGSGLLVSRASNIGDAFRDYFLYKNAVTCTSESTLADANGRANALLANLDAGFPVIVLITGPSGGHAVVGDGYGFSSDVDTPYVHLNMGWSGQNDVWYNLPYINVSENPESFSGFNVLPAMAYNLFPATNGVEILSGHVTTNGVAVTNAVVTLYASGTELESTVTSSHGVYSFMVSPGRAYRIEASLPGRTLVGETETGKILSSTASAAGNVWGLDMELAPPVARFGGVGYASLSTALSMAGAAAAGASSPQEIEILAAAPLRADFTVDFDCSIVATNADAALSPVVRTGGAALFVVSNETAGATLSLSNVVFETAGETVVDVAGGCRLVLAGTIEAERISTADATCLFLAGAVETDGGIVVDCAAAAGEGETFAMFDASSVAAADVGAGRFVNAAEDTLFGVASAAGALSWAYGACDPGIAKACVRSGVATNYYYQLDHAVMQTPAVASGDAVEIVLLKRDASLTLPLAVTGSLSVASAMAVPTVVTVASSAGFSAVSDTSSIVVSNVTFTGFSGDAFFAVSGGGSLTLDNGVTLSGFTGTNTVAQARSGAVAVKKGTATIREGAVIENCSVRRSGGAVSLSGAGCVLNLEGGTITGCSAVRFGGGVFAGSGAQVNVSGDSVVKGNSSGAGDDDIYLQAKTALTLAGEISGDGEVGVRYAAASNYLNSAGGDFMAVDTSVAAGAATNSCEHLFSDVSGDIVATVSADGASLVWAERPAGDGQVDAADATVLVVFDGGATTNFYDSLETAFEGLPGGQADVVLLANVAFGADLEVAGDVTLRSSGGGLYFALRTGDAAFDVPAGASLSVTNVDVCGGFYGGFAMYGSNTLFRVDGGTLSLLAGSAVYGSFGDGSRAAGAITVWNGGSFSMEGDALVYDCGNDYANSVPANTGIGGALHASGAGTVVRLRGGEISYCSADRAGGVFVDNGAVAYVSGDVVVWDNVANATSTNGNFMVADTSTLVVDGEFTGLIGFTEGTQADTNVFAVAENWRDWGGVSALTNSAAGFYHDLTGSIGAAVTNDTADALLVWRTSLAEDGSFSYTDPSSGETKAYHVVGDGSEVPSPEPPAPPAVVVVPCEPFAFSSIELQADGSWQLTLSNGVETCTYTLYTADELKAVSTSTWDRVGSTNLTVDGFFHFTVPPADAKRFWFATGEDGEKPVAP